MERPETTVDERPLNSLENLMVLERQGMVWDGGLADTPSAKSRTLTFLVLLTGLDF